jgi:hypothetical protein
LLRNDNENEDGHVVNIDHGGVMYSTEYEMVSGATTWQAEE